MHYFLDLWQSSLTVDSQPNQADYFLLSDSERKQAASFRQPKSGYLYVKMRAILRTILADYVKMSPTHINFTKGQYGKPFIVDSKIFFNLSHSANQFALAVSNFPDIGVDIEQYRSRHHLAALVKRCFAEPERYYWENLPEHQKLSKFYQFWVKKEAFVKAVGRGIALGLEQCVINPSQPNEFLMIPSQYGQHKDWKIHEQTFANNTICAVVYPNIKNVNFSLRGEERMLDNRM